MVYAMHEFRRDTQGKTGRVEYYSADNPFDAADKCLYTKRLSDGSARKGPSQRTIFTATHIYVAVKD